MSQVAHLSMHEERSASVLTGSFRRVAQIDEASERSTIVHQAVARAQRGDREALRFLYVRYADNVYGYVLSLLGDEHDAEDVTQQVFAKLLVVLPKYERREVPFAAWILRIARNAALDFMRARRAIPCEEVRPAGNEEDQDETRQRSILFRDALDSLPEDQRKVLYLRHVVGLSPGEIAERLGKTEPAIHGLHHRGRGALRAALSLRECAPTVRTGMAA
jgi:RNA polymerase sigma-70 factor (ECF subfamily)